MSLWNEASTYIHISMHMVLFTQIQSGRIGIKFTLAYLCVYAQTPYIMVAENNIIIEKEQNVATLAEHKTIAIATKGTI